MQQIEKSYRTGKSDLKLLKGIDLHIKEGEFVAIMGSSGSGKSTLLNILGILDSYDTGSYHLGGTLVRNMNETKAARFRNESIGFVFQSFNLINYKTAAENVALPLYYQRVSRKVRMHKAQEFLEKVGLGERANHLPNEMSGGEKQRVAIARALITNPKVLLADEPTGALDTVTSYKMMDLLKNINAEGKTVVVVTHEHDIAEMTQRTIHIKDGLIDLERESESIAESY